MRSSRRRSIGSSTKAVRSAQAKSARSTASFTVDLKPFCCLRYQTKRSIKSCPWIKRRSSPVSLRRHVSKVSRNWSLSPNRAPAWRWRSTYLAESNQIVSPAREQHLSIGCHARFQLRILLVIRMAKASASGPRIAAMTSSPDFGNPRTTSLQGCENNKRGRLLIH